jgi:hypothetical protein
VGRGHCGKWRKGCDQGVANAGDVEKNKKTVNQVTNRVVKVPLVLYRFALIVLVTASINIISAKV